MTRRYPPAILALAFCAACGAEGPGPVTPPPLIEILGSYSVRPIDSAGATLVVHDVNASGTAVGFFIEGGVATTAFRWDNGSFSALPFTGSGLSINGLGDVVGRVGDVPKIQFADSGFASTMFRPDTQTASLYPAGINNAREVVLRVGAVGDGPGIFVWKSGQYRTVAFASSCPFTRGINQQGVVLLQPQCGGIYSHWTTVRSPFQTNPVVPSGKFAGKTCGSGRHSDGKAINDSNEVIGTHEVSLSPPSVSGFWKAAGCLDIGTLYQGAGFTTLNNLGALAGSRSTSTGSWGVVAVAGSYGDADDLLTPRGVWHITKVLKIFDNGLMFAQGMRIADQRTTYMLLVPE